MTFFLGLDLGQAQDPTAIAILEHHELPGTEKTQTWSVMGPAMSGRPRIRQVQCRSAERGPVAFTCGHLMRLRLGTSYPAVADHVIALLETPTLKGRTELVVDATGVGRPVVDMFRQRGLQRSPSPSPAATW